MLATLAVFVSILLIACTLAALIFWIYDSAEIGSEAGVSRAAMSEYPVRARRRPPHFRRPAPRLLERRGIHGRHECGSGCHHASPAG
jgi:hypothetical protein